MSLLLLILSVKTALFCLKACSSLVPASAQVPEIIKHVYHHMPSATDATAQETIWKVLHVLAQAYTDEVVLTLFEMDEQSQRGSDDQESTFNVGDLGSIPGSGRSPGGRHGNPLQYYYVENPMDRRAWPATVHGVAESRTRLRD